jgi:asparagine synthetase B (glutamine-hydrolysing)
VPRILICCGPQATRRLEQGLRRLWPEVPADIAGGDAGSDRANILRGEELAVYVGDVAGPVRDDDSGVSVAAGVVLALEGFLTNRPERGAGLRSALIEDFLAHGERCVENWRGSFRLLISHRGVARIYTDHTASRVLFVADDAFGPIYSSHAAPLLAAVPRTTVDGANLLHFMRNGRFFAGASLFHEVRQVGPGRCHRIGSRDTDRSQFAWYRYRLQPQPVAVREVLPELKRRLDSAVLRHWRRADAPVLLLSGGYDSRYILNTLAQNVRPESLRRLFTCLWGEPSSDADCDAAWAAREARRHGVAYEFFPLQADLPSLFESTFEAQSGMTAHVITHTDDLARCRYLRRLGFRSLLRGDECFGPNGTEVQDIPGALSRIGLNGLPLHMPWLAPDARTADWRAAHQHQLGRLGQVADEPNDVRDLLYFHERLPSVQAPLNAHRSRFMENHNPLLDADVLDLVRQLPRELRTDKRIFRLCFQEYFPTGGFAGSGNAFNIQRLWRQEELARFIAEKLEQLPAPFADRYFGPLAMRFRLAATGERRPPSAEQIHLACRAVVLGHGLRQGVRRSGGCA